MASAVPKGARGTHILYTLAHPRARRGLGMEVGKDGGPYFAPASISANSQAPVSAEQIEFQDGFHIRQPIEVMKGREWSGGHWEGREGNALR